MYETCTRTDTAQKNTEKHTRLGRETLTDTDRQKDRQTQTVTDRQNKCRQTQKARQTSRRTAYKQEKRDHCLCISPFDTFSLESFQDFCFESEHFGSSRAFEKGTTTALQRRSALVQTTMEKLVEKDSLVNMNIAGTPTTTPVTPKKTKPTKRKKKVVKLDGLCINWRRWTRRRTRCPLELRRSLTRAALVFSVHSTLCRNMEARVRAQNR